MNPSPHSARFGSRSLLLLALAVGAAACAGGGQGGSTGSGGSGSGSGGSGAGGSTASGGSNGSGGSGAGGSTASGGSNGSGGSNSGSGGANSSGGNTGSGGNTSSGGNTGSGGAPASGGNNGTGGNGSGGSVSTGGNTGSGGTSGSGGAPATGGATGTGGTAGGTGCTGLALCDNFDTQAAGSAPDASLWTMIGAKTCSTQGTPWPFAVDSTQSHSPPNSMKVSGGDSCGPLMLNTSAFTMLTGSDVYGRFYVRLSDTSMTFDHAFLMALGLTSGTFNTNNQNSYLQLASEGAGNATNVFMWQSSDGNILPDKNTTGGATSTYPKANTWTCVEFHTSSTGTLETWVDGTAIAGLTFIPGTTAKVSGVNDQWTAPSPFTPTSIGFGWTVFSGENLTVWFDDVAVGSARIGCQ